MVVKKIREAFGNLQSKNRFFVSEADFQHALAMELEKYFPDNVYCEFPVYSNYLNKKKRQIIHIDIMVQHRGVLYPIELKYKTRQIKSEKYYKNTNICIKDVLRTHSAQDINAYEFWKDVRRIECLSLSDNSQITSGVCIMITNDPIYYKALEENNKSSSVIWRDFLLNDGLKTECNCTKQWHSHALWTKKYPPLDIKNSYECKWEHFCTVEKREFKSLFIEVKRPNV